MTVNAPADQTRWRAAARREQRWWSVSRQWCDSSARHDCSLCCVNCGIRWSMAPLHVTYSDNMSEMKIWMLHDLIWRASLRDIDRALFGDASSFLAVRDLHIPKFPPSCVSALYRPMTFFQSSPTWLAHQAGQWVVALYTAITHIPLSMSCN